MALNGNQIAQHSPVANKAVQNNNEGMAKRNELERNKGEKGWDEGMEVVVREIATRGLP